MGGPGFEHFPRLAIAIQNYISRDANQFLQAGNNGDSEPFIQKTFAFLENVFNINRNVRGDQNGGILAMKIIIALIENLS